MRFLIADDHALIRQALVNWLRESYPAAAITEAEEGLTAEKLAKAEKPDIIILDISLPDKNGLEVLKQLRSEEINIPILILSNHPEDQYAIRAFRAGANGYLAKNCSHDELIRAIRVILSGRKYISSKVAENMAALLDNNVPRELHQIISDRELQVLKFLASGKTVSQIADELSLSVATISTYRARLLEKMNMSNNAELTRYAIDNGLV
jgi:two-component system, NarL family, invasion response regulator UvrY